MEVFGTCDKLAHPEISGSSIKSSIDPPSPVLCGCTNISMNDLNTCLTKCLKIEDTEISTTGLSPYLGKNAVGNGVGEHECRSADETNSDNSCSGKCLHKCATFPTHHCPKSSEGLFLGKEEIHNEGTSSKVPEVSGSSEPTDQHFLRCLSLPAPLKLVSALKGSRRELGLPPKKLSITWAPDVYDPVPTSVSHVPSYMNQRHRSDGKKSVKYRKGGGKSSRGGSKGKDKKQGRKIGGDWNKPKPFHGANGIVDFGQPQVGSVELDVGSPNPSCERSFLQTSATNLHFPAAEAT